MYDIVLALQMSWFTNAIDKLALINVIQKCYFLPAEHSCTNTCSRSYNSSIIA